VLRARGIAVLDAVQRRIQAERDLARLERWIERTSVASSVAEVINDASWRAERGARVREARANGGARTIGKANRQRWSSGKPYASVAIMPSLRTYDLFISHAWSYGEDYYRIVEMLDAAPNFSAKDVQCDQAMLVRKERGCDNFVKFGTSSSGCNSRPANGWAARAGSEPCDGRGDTAGDA
jgi:hypothetical protein